MGKAIKIGNKEDIIYRMKAMLDLVKSCSNDATFLFTYEIAQLDSDFMKKSEKFNEKLREYEQKQMQKQLEKQLKESKKEDNI